MHGQAGAQRGLRFVVLFPMNKGCAKFEEHGRVCDFGTRAWAPSVAFDGERWIMLYGPDRLRAAVCDDARLDHWREAPCSLVGAPLEAVLRDGMIFRLDHDSWLLYATGKRGRCGTVSVCVSENLLDWRFVRHALVTTPEAPSNVSWAATESPFVFRHAGAYWLSITYTKSFGGPGEYHNTLLFRSENPFDFRSFTNSRRRICSLLLMSCFSTPISSRMAFCFA